MASSKCPYGLGKLSNRAGGPYPGLLVALRVGILWCQLLRPQWSLHCWLVPSQSLQIKGRELETCHKGTWKDRLGFAHISLPTRPWPLLTVTWKGLLGTCSPPKRTQMTYLPGWGAV